MKGTINDIWDVVDELVEENLDMIIESEPEETEEGLLSEENLEDDTKGDYESERESEKEDEILQSHGTAGDDFDYWMQEFDNIFKDYVPSTRKKPSNGLSPILLGGGGVILLGLITSVAVAIKIKRNPRKFRVLPAVEEVIVQENNIQTEQEKLMGSKKENMFIPFFNFQLPNPLFIKSRGVS